MTPVARIADGFWFAPVPAARLAVLRVLIGGYALVYLTRRRRMLAQVAATDPALFAPVGAARLHRTPLPIPIVRGLIDATLAANLAFLLGWRYRASGPTFAGLLLWLLSYRNSWSMIYHNDNVLVLHVLVLGATPAADALALDARSLGRGAGDWRYGWPIRLMNTVTLLTYFLSGVAKLKGPLGRRWASGEALRSQVAVDGLRKELLGGGAAPLAYALHDRLALYRLLALGSLAVEVGAPAVLADRRLARIWAVNAFLMHWGIFAVMKIRFRYQMAGVIYAPFFETDRVLDWLVDRWEERRWPRSRRAQRRSSRARGASARGRGARCGRSTDPGERRRRLLAAVRASGRSGAARTRRDVSRERCRRSFLVEPTKPTRRDRRADANKENPR